MARKRQVSDVHKDKYKKFYLKKDNRFLKSFPEFFEKFRISTF